MPPKNEDTMLAMPCPRASVFLFELLSVLSSRMSWVRKVSIKPTKEMARAVGNTIPKVSKLNGTRPSAKAPKGMPKLGRPEGSSPRLRTVGISKPNRMLISVSTTIATSCEGTTRVRRGRP